MGRSSEGPIFVPERRSIAVILSAGEGQLDLSGAGRLPSARIVQVGVKPGANMPPAWVSSPSSSLPDWRASVGSPARGGGAGMACDSCAGGKP